jgi:hypothetical protein
MAEREIAGCYCDVIHMTCSICRKRTDERKEDSSIPGLNIYGYTFSAICPADGETIIYRLEIRTTAMIHVEHIKTATALIKKGWHEQIANRLAEALGGDQVITAVHQGVDLKSVRLSE